MFKLIVFSVTCAQIIILKIMYALHMYVVHNAHRVLAILKE